VHSTANAHALCSIGRLHHGMAERERSVCAAEAAAAPCTEQQRSPCSRQKHAAAAWKGLGRVLKTGDRKTEAWLMLRGETVTTGKRDAELPLHG